MPEATHVGPLRYAVAAVAVAAALITKLLLDPLIDEESPFLLFFAAVVVSAWHGGLGPGLLATLLAALVSNYLFLTPIYSFFGHTLSQNLRLGIFVFEGVLISSLSAALKAARQRAEANRRATLICQEALRQSEERYRLLNAGFEQRVIERTVQLEEDNKELEAFNYSVTHDLRAPLRSIDGFSKALLEDYTDRLDQPGRNHLQHVRGAVQRMRNLIDDLLNLSRATRGKMNCDTIDLSQLTQSVVEQLQKGQPGRRVELRVADNLVTRADARLMHIALENLLGNAWKFTAKQPHARIELGMTESKGENPPAYFVRDNGAGFDMKYADKLFSPFQRLHGVKDFEGTGVGLATVQRIVRRHGGHIWAEGVVGKGATFYFTLQPHC